MPVRRRNPLFNALLVQAEQDLAEVAAELGEDPAPHREGAAGTRAALNERLWDDELRRYVAYDLGHSHALEAPVVAGFGPLFGGVPDEARAAAMVEELEGPGFWPPAGEGYPVPTQDRLAPGFSRERYWRGPVWANVNWLLVRGLERYGYREPAERLRSATLELVSRSGFREYFDPVSGEGRGSEEFSWTAAVVLDLVLGSHL